MIRITKLTDYGFVLLSLMGKDKSQMPGESKTYTAHELALAAHLPQTVVSKILKMLAKHGIVTSLRGVGGGYRLKESPNHIRLLDIIEAMEGPPALTDCSRPEKHPPKSACIVGKNCPVHAGVKRINQMIIETMASITLEEMIQQERHS